MGEEKVLVASGNPAAVVRMEIDSFSSPKITLPQLSFRRWFLETVLLGPIRQSDIDQDRARQSAEIRQPIKPLPSSPAIQRSLRMRVSPISERVSQTPPGLRGRGFVSSMRKSLLGEGLLTPRSLQKRLPLRAKNKGFSTCAEKTPPSNPSL